MKIEFDTNEMVGRDAEWLMRIINDSAVVYFKTYDSRGDIKYMRFPEFLQDFQTDEGATSHYGICLDLTQDEANSSDCMRCGSSDDELVDGLCPYCINQANKELSDQFYDNIEKSKATFSLSKATLARLEDMWLFINLRRQLNNESRITKTLLVEKALETAIEEWKTSGEESKICELVRKNRTTD